MPVQTRATITPYAGAGVSVVAMTLHGWKGWIPDLQALPDEFIPLGGNGSGAQILGKRGRKKSCSGWQGFTDESLAKSFADRWEQLEGQTVRIVDGWGRNLPRVRLTECQVEVIKTRGPIISGTTQISIRVECTAMAERLANP